MVRHLTWLSALASLLGCPSSTPASEMDGGPIVDAAPNDALPPEPDLYVRSGPRVCTIPELEPEAAADCPPLEERERVVVTGDINTDTTWSCDRLYEIDDGVFVNGGATLTVEPGVWVVTAGNAWDDLLVISSEGRIDARGTRTDPIVFTTTIDPSAPAAQWRGISLMGRAPINVAGGTNVVESLPPGETFGSYGGTDERHDCGTMRYVRVEHMGFDHDSGGAALTVAGCGSETTLDFVQVHDSDWDGVRIFGGSASLGHVVATDVDSDSIDYDEGWQGAAQFIAVKQSERGNRAIEGDNLGSDQDTTPRSDPTFWNVTLVGSHEDNEGMRLREGTAGTFRNTIVSGYPSTCVRVDNSSTLRQANEGALSIADSIFHDCGTVFDFTPDDGDLTTTFTGDWRTPNHMGVDPLLADGDDPERPDFTTPADSPAAWGAVPSESFDTRADFIGAIEPGCWDWTEGWTAYPPRAR